MAKQKKTFAIIKPGSIKRQQMGEIISLIEKPLENRKPHLIILRMRLVWVTRDQLEKHYHKDLEWFNMVGNKIIGRLAEGEKPQKSAEEYGREALEQVIAHMKSGPMLIMEIEGDNAIKDLMELAEMIRKMYGVDIVDNALHRSDSDESAEYELSIWNSWF